MQTPDDLVRLATFLQRYPDLVSEGAIRWQIFNRHENTLEASGAVVKGKNGRWLVSPSRYREWLAGGGA